MAWEASMFPHGSHTHAATMFFVFYLALMVKFGKLMRLFVDLAQMDYHVIFIFSSLTTTDYIKGSMPWNHSFT
jgi:hypothetical protein